MSITEEPVKTEDGFNMPEAMKKTGKLYGIGVGPGDPELMTIKAVRLLKECDVIAVPGKDPMESVAYRIAAAACPEIADKEKLYIKTPMSKDLDELEKGYRSLAGDIEVLLTEGKDVALLTLGDPTIYSTYIYIHRNVVKDGFSAEIVSGVPSFCAAAARMGRSLADRDAELHIIPASYQIEDKLNLSGTKVLMKAGSKLGKVSEIIGNSDRDAYMIENCGMKDEKIYRNKEDFPESGSYYSIIVVS